MMKDRPLRVLLLAEACNPEWTSAPLLAYYWYRALRSKLDVTLVTQVRNRPAFERMTPAPANVVFIDSEPVARPCYRIGRWLTFGRAGGLATKGVAAWPAYLYFEYLTWRLFRDRLLRGEFDLVHRLTPLSPTIPSPLARVCPVPFVLGPLNGAIPWPRGTWRERWREGGALSPFRRAYRWLPFVQSTYTRASLILAGTRYVERELFQLFGCQCRYLPENGVDTDLFHPGDRQPPGAIEPFTLLFVGRLIELKNPAIVLEAVRAAGLAPKDVKVVFVGAGPEENRLRAMVRNTPWLSTTVFAGWVPHVQLPGYYRTASLLVLPSTHESGGAVLLEAMACGLPSLVLDHGGPAEYVTDDAGVRIPLGSNEQLVGRISQVFTRLYADRPLLNRLGTACVDAVQRSWRWETKAARLTALYAEISREPTASQTAGGAQQRRARDSKEITGSLTAKNLT